MTRMEHPRTIKTQCGIDKYHVLRQKNGFFNKSRLLWFVFFATIVDFFKNSVHAQKAV